MLGFVLVANKYYFIERRQLLINNAFTSYLLALLRYIMDGLESNRQSDSDKHRC